MKKVRTKPKKMQNPFKQFGKNNEIWTKQWENTHKTNGKRLGIGFPSSTQQHSAALSSTQQHSAALSSTQQCSICNQFQGFLTFCRVRVEKVKRSQKITQNQSNHLEKQCENTHTKQMEKGMGLYFSPFLRFSDFLQGQG